MVHEATFSLVYADVEEATLLEASLRPEVGDIGGERTRATLRRDGVALELTIEAEDLIALRAGINTWLTLADVAERSSATDLR